MATRQKRKQLSVYITLIIADQRTHAPWQSVVGRVIDDLANFILARLYGVTYDALTLCYKLISFLH